MSKSNRTKIAKDTLEILQRGSYTNNQGELIDIAEAQKTAVMSSRVLKPDELIEQTEDLTVEPRFESTKFVVNHRTTLDSLRKEHDGTDGLAYLNFASAKNPGGGFLKGSQAQEESIARASGLYPCLERGQVYYNSNRRVKTCLYTDHMIYSPLVPVIKNEDGSLMDQPLLASVVTAPAVNAGVVLQREPQNVDAIDQIMSRRIDMVLGLFYKHGYHTLILGAWGCGVFKNDPANIAGLFHAHLTGKYANAFKKVVFSVFDRDDRIIKPFQRLFGG